MERLEGTEEGQFKRPNVNGGPLYVWTVSKGGTLFYSEKTENTGLI